MAPLRKTGITLLGWLLVVVGIVALALPGPGLLLLLAGLVVLSGEYSWAERRVEPVRRKTFDVARSGVAGELQREPRDLPLQLRQAVDLAEAERHARLAGLRLDGRVEVRRVEDHRL